MQSCVKFFHPRMSFERIHCVVAPDQDIGVGTLRLSRALHSLGVGMIRRTRLTFADISAAIDAGRPVLDSTEADKQLLVQRDRSWSEYFFDQGRGNRMPGVEGTLWAAFTGVTEWMDHRKTRQNENQRLSSSWFGETARVKSRAHAVAMDKTAVWN